MNIGTDDRGLAANGDGRQFSSWLPPLYLRTRSHLARIVAAKVLLDRGWGKPKEMHHSEVDDNKTLLKVVNEIVHVYETREQIEFTDGTPLLERPAQRSDGNGIGNGNGSSTY